MRSKYVKLDIRTRKQIAKKIYRDIDFVNNWLNKRKEGIIID